MKTHVDSHNSNLNLALIIRNLSTATTSTLIRTSAMHKDESLAWNFLAMRRGGRPSQDLCAMPSDRHGSFVRWAGIGGRRGSLAWCKGAQACHRTAVRCTGTGSGRTWKLCTKQKDETTTRKIHAMHGGRRPSRKLRTSPRDRPHHTNRPTAE